MKSTRCTWIAGSLLGSTLPLFLQSAHHTGPAHPHKHVDSSTYTALNQHGLTQPARQKKSSRRPLLRRRSMWEELEDTEAPLPSSSLDALATVTHNDAGAHPDPTRTTEGYFQPSQYEETLRSYVTSSQRHHSAVAAATQTIKAKSALSPAHEQREATALRDLQRQQGVLREAFHHAYKQHNVRMRKDRGVYLRECKAFQQAHNGRRPTSAEVSLYVNVTLAPVAAIKALAHTDAARSPIHGQVQDAMLLHQSVTRNQLVHSNEPTLMRCLGCFTVYTARPRTLWGEEVEQSWIDYEKEKEKVAKAEELAKCPAARKKIYSMGRRRARASADPQCCPKCQGKRAQWMMEYVHHRTHYS